MLGLNLQPGLDIEKMIKDTIRKTLISVLSIDKLIYLKRIKYFPTYTICEVTGDKSLSAIYMKSPKNIDYFKMTVRQIEVTGASIIEFIDYLYEIGAKEEHNCKELLNMV